MGMLGRDPASGTDLLDKIIRSNLVAKLLIWATYDPIISIPGLLEIPKQILKVVVNQYLLVINSGLRRLPLFPD